VTTEPTAAVYKYRVIHMCHVEIKKHRIEKETAKRIVYHDESWNNKPIKVTEAKDSGYHSWHDTWDDAYAHLCSIVANRVDRTRESLRSLEAKLETVRSMTEPQEE
jgi:hypothetical protein